MPNASAPNAPWVLVWLSPQTTVWPGQVAPCSGPTTCTMPRSGLSRPRSSTPNSAQFSIIARTWAAAAGSATFSNSSSVEAGSVGVEWSIVASVRSGRRTGRPFARSTSKACGVVTSCTRCRSM